MDVAAGDTEGGMVTADGFFVRAVEQAEDGAFVVVVELDRRTSNPSARPWRASSAIWEMSSAGSFES